MIYLLIGAVIGFAIGVLLQDAEDVVGWLYSVRRWLTERIG